MAVKYKLARCYGSKCIITTVLIMFTLHRNEVFDVISSYCFDCHSYADDSQMRTTVFPGHSSVVGRHSQLPLPHCLNIDEDWPTHTHCE